MFLEKLAEYLILLLGLTGSPFKSCFITTVSPYVKFSSLNCTVLFFQEGRGVSFAVSGA